VSSDWEHVQLLLVGGVARVPQAHLCDVLRLVRGVPLADATPGQWGWAEDWRLEMVSVVCDVGVTLCRQALGLGDVGLARWAVTRALMAVPGDVGLLAARIETEHVAGNRLEVKRLVIQITRQARILGRDLPEEIIAIIHKTLEDGHLDIR
jgi:hypothetical protein